MLLTEYRPFQVDRQLAEASIKENKPLMVKGVIQRAEAKNQNGRIYPKEILEREINKYISGPVREKRALGELDHPESSVINLQNVSHNVTRIKMVADLEAETIDFKKLSEDNPDDIVLFNLSEELKELFNKFRTHVRKNYE